MKFQKIIYVKANYGFEYINTYSHTASWGSTESDYEITGRGRIAWNDEVFTIAKNNYAYSYVIVPNDDKVYSIDEVREIFLID